jgi:hypothetical protein
MGQNEGKGEKSDMILLVFIKQICNNIKSTMYKECIKCPLKIEVTSSNFKDNISMNMTKGKRDDVFQQGWMKVSSQNYRILDFEVLKKKKNP